MLGGLKQAISVRILRYLDQPTGRYAPFFTPASEVMRRALKPGDVLLIEGNTRLAAIIKYLTQSTWSHAALYIGDALSAGSQGDTEGGEPLALIEALASQGVVAAPLSKFSPFHKRICRPVGLSPAEIERVIDYAVARIGIQYDSKQIIDLARYLWPYPPVPVAIRRRMLAWGGGDPTKAICSTLIAEAFASVHYPILPERVTIGGKTYGVAPYVEGEIEHIRAHGLYTPRDFDVSPYFAVIKPTVEEGFDPHALRWAPEGSE